MRLARDTSTSSYSRESHDTDYVVDIPLSDFRSRTPEPDESEETGLIVSHNLRIAQEQDQQQQRQYSQLGSQYDEEARVKDDSARSCNSDTEVASFLPEEGKEEDDDESKDFGMWLGVWDLERAKKKVYFALREQNEYCLDFFFLWLVLWFFLLWLTDKDFSFVLCTCC